MKILDLKKASSLLSTAEYFESVAQYISGAFYLVRPGLASTAGPPCLSLEADAAMRLKEALLLVADKCRAELKDFGVEE
jgi:hypothetical protein